MGKTAHKLWETKSIVHYPKIILSLNRSLLTFKIHADVYLGVNLSKTCALVLVNSAFNATHSSTL